MSTELTKIKPSLSDHLTQYQVRVDGVYVGDVYKFRRATNHKYGKRYIIRTSYATKWCTAPNRYEPGRWVQPFDTRGEAVLDLIEKSAADDTGLMDRIRAAAAS